MPGLLAGLAGACISVVAPEMFPQMAPDRIPGAVAMLATKIWISGMGLALLAIGGWYEIKEWMGQ